jgi:tartrate-resistant acid phosphatase type 5
MTSRRSTIALLTAASLLATLVFSSACAPPARPAASETATTSAAATAGVATATVATTTVATASIDSTAPSRPETQSTTFAVIGDFGVDNRHERDVADLVASWNPSFIVTVGDNHYKKRDATGARAFSKSVGDYYGEWLDGAFFPALGNHDYDVKPAPKAYTDYFDLPGGGLTNTSGNERYYDFVQGPIHFFVVNSNPEELHGTGSSSKQAKWLKRQLKASSSKCNVVVAHHPPYSSDGEHGPARYMRWPFAEWGADVVLSGHNHGYERVMRNGIVYFTNGLGGATRYDFGSRTTGSKVRYMSDWGAQKVTITDTAIVFEFYNVSGERIDRYSVRAK